MNLKILRENQCYDLNLIQITQVCGVDFEKKNFIFNSLTKYFSASKYMAHEQNMIANIMLDGERVGRKYFSVVHIRSREDILEKIRMTKTGILMKYFEISMTNFDCQMILDNISEQLEHLYIKINEIFFNAVPNLLLGFEQNDILKIIQNSTVHGKEEGDLNELSNKELLEILCHLLVEISRKVPEKYLIIIENLDHLITYKEYIQMISYIEEIVSGYDIWFMFSMSTDGYVFLDEITMEGVNIINSLIYILPDIERIYDFVMFHYPTHSQFGKDELLKLLRKCIHQIGKEDYEIALNSFVLLKIINSTLCIKTKCKNAINNLEMAFLYDNNVLE